MSSEALQTTFIRTASDGRKIEVIGAYVCIGGEPVANSVVDVGTHPNRKAILASLPFTTHMAGPLALTADEASLVRGALAKASDPITDRVQIEERLRHAYNRRNSEAGIE